MKDLSGANCSDKEYKPLKINILGSLYTIKRRSIKEDVRMNGKDGFVDWTTKEIVLEKEFFGDLGKMEIYTKNVLRHEIVHAFFTESGLENYSNDEVLVDWISMQLPKIVEAMAGVCL